MTDSKPLSQTTTKERWLAGLLWDSATDKDGLTFRLMGSRDEAKVSVEWPSKGSRAEIVAALRALANDLEDWERWGPSTMAEMNP